MLSLEQSDAALQNNTTWNGNVTLALGKYGHSVLSWVHNPLALRREEKVVMPVLIVVTCRFWRRCDLSDH